MVKDLLVRVGGNVAAQSMVGWYVLYSGKGQIVRTSSNYGSRPQLQGIVLAEHKTSNRKKVMCEVLYTNGWVIWHNKASFTEKTSSRTARLLAFRTLTDMLRNTAEYVMSNTNPDEPLEDPLEHWIRSMEEFQQILNTGERRQGADAVRARLQALVRDMKTVYNGFA
jgi:predicted dehydrogenase